MQQAQPHKMKLLLREKCAVFGMLLMLATIAPFAFVAKNKKHANLVQKIRVHCVGAVDPEVWLELSTGAKWSDLLAKLVLSQDADISKLVLEESLKNNQTCIIPTKGKTSLYVCGAVKEPGVVYVPDGCRYNELMAHLELSEDADCALFRRRKRILADGETVEVPKKGEIIVNNF